MQKQASGTFDVQATSHPPYDTEEGATLRRATFTKHNNAEDQKTANITARNNTYNGGSGEKATGGGGRAFTAAPYAAVIQPPAELPALIRKCAGPH